MVGSRAGRRAVAVLGGALLAFGSPLGVLGQTPPLEGGVGVTVQSFSFSEGPTVGIERVTLIVAPWAASMRLGGRAIVSLDGAFARGSLSGVAGLDFEVSGVTDSRFSLVVPVADESVVFTALAVLPTGKTTLSGPESVVAGVVAADLLPFRISNWGTGGGFGGSVAASRRAGVVGMGVSVGYLVARQFDLGATDALRYEPGDVLRVNGVIDGTVRGGGKLSLRLGLQRFGDDAVASQNLFRAGNRYEATASWAFTAGPRASAIVYAGVQHRGQGSFLKTLQERANQDLLLTGGGVRIPLAGVVFTPSAEIRVFRREDGRSQGWLTALGSGAEVKTTTAVWMPFVRAYFGTVELSQALESGFTGLEAGLAVRFGRRVR